MSPEKKVSWFCQMCAVMGAAFWMWFLTAFVGVPMAVFVGIFVIPATIANIISEARSTEPVCS